MTNQELFLELTSTEKAVCRSVEALIQATERYAETFPQSVKNGLPSYTDAKSNASAAYYMYATALTYIVTSIEKALSLLSPLAERANEAQIPEIPERCAALISAYEKFSEETLSVYFEKSQKLILSDGNSFSLSALYQATRELEQRSKEFLTHLS